MHSILRSKALWYTTGAVIGGGIGGFLVPFLVKRFQEKKKEEAIQQEFDFKKAQEELDYQAKSEPTEDWQPTFMKKEGKKPLKTPTDYNAIARKYQAKPELEDLAKEKLGEDGTDVEQDPELSNTPRVISLDQFADKRFHNHATLNYYTVDDVLVDSEDKPITNVEELLGEDALVKFGQGSNDPDTVYIRNDRTATDYEVCAIHKSFEETVLGLKKRSSKKGRTTKVRVENETEESE